MTVNKEIILVMSKGMVVEEKMGKGDRVEGKGKR